jgi:hypothetical protein
MNREYNFIHRNLYEQNQHLVPKAFGTIRPLKNNFLRMKKLFLITSILFFVNNIYSQVTFTETSGSFNSDCGVNTDIFLQPAGAQKVEVTFTHLDCADMLEGYVNVYDGNYGSSNLLISFDRDHQNFPVTVTATTGKIWIVYDWWNGGCPIFRGTYRGIYPQWTTINGSDILYNNGNATIGGTTSVTNARLNLQGGGLNIGGSGNLDASLHIKSSFGGFDRLTQIHPTIANKSALNLMASTNASGNYNWWSWGVLTSGVWAFQPTTTFGGTTGLFIDRNGNVGVGTTTPGANLSFGNLNDGRDTPDGITWYSPSPLAYGIYRTSGPWTAPNYQQLKFSWDTGIVIDGGYAYGKSGIVLQPNGGNVLIGKTTQTNPAYKLEVEGSIRSREIKVNTDGADFVFDEGYKLRSLSEVEAFIKQHKHLPDIAPAAEMQANGVNMGELQTKLLQKVEELTLYTIELKKENEEQEKRNDELQKRVEEQDAKYQELLKMIKASR